MLQLKCRSKNVRFKSIKTLSTCSILISNGPLDWHCGHEPGFNSWFCPWKNGPKINLHLTQSYLTILSCGKMPVLDVTTPLVRISWFKWSCLKIKWQISLPRNFSTTQTICKCNTESQIYLQIAQRVGCYQSFTYPFAVKTNYDQEKRKKFCHVIQQRWEIFCQYNQWPTINSVPYSGFARLGKSASKF